LQYKAGKIATKILSLQEDDGSWGCFHTQKRGSLIPFTTEHALFRLESLGFSFEDECIKKAVEHIESLLLSKTLPEGNEKSVDFPIFVELIAATWIRRFTNSNLSANTVAEKWARIISKAFNKQVYSHEDYLNCFENEFQTKPRSGRLVDFVSFYQLSLLADMLDEKTENRMLDHVLSHPDGIYYVYENNLFAPPNFQSKDASRYIGVAELILRYRCGKDKIKHIFDWLWQNQDSDGMWDMGSAAKDGVFFPLSDRWNLENRVSDCTFRIRKILADRCYCGHDCSRCITFVATKHDDNSMRQMSQEFYRSAFGMDISMNKFNCYGGRTENKFELCHECPFTKCCKQQGIDFCADCAKYPCEKIALYESKHVNKSNQM